MIRVIFFYSKAYGYDVSDWESQPSYTDNYDNLLVEDLIERVSEGDKVMYFDSPESAEEWCMEYSFDFEMISDDNN